MGLEEPGEQDGQDKLDGRTDRTSLMDRTDWAD